MILVAKHHEKFTNSKLLNDLGLKIYLLIGPIFIQGTNHYAKN